MIVLPTGFFGSSAATPFVPPAGCLCWLKDDVTLAAGKVASWTDMSGSGNHFAQATAANQPTQVAAVQNGNPAILFDDAATTRIGCSVFRSGTQAGEIFLVLQSLENVQQHPHQFGSNTNGVEEWPSGVPHGTSRTGWGQPYSIYLVAVFDESAWNIFGASSDDTTTPKFTVRVNDVEINTAANSPSWNTGDFVLGAELFYATWAYWHGYMGEMIMFDHCLSAGDRALVNAYLKTKWATP